MAVTGLLTASKYMSDTLAAMCQLQLWTCKETTWVCLHASGLVNLYCATPGRCPAATSMHFVSIMHCILSTFGLRVAALQPCPGHTSFHASILCYCRVVDVELHLGHCGRTGYVKNIESLINSVSTRPGQAPLLSGSHAFPQTNETAVKTISAYPAHANPGDILSDGCRPAA